MATVSSTALNELSLLKKIKEEVIIYTENPEVLFISVPGLIIYLLLLFRTGLLIYNEEKFISAFYEALRKRYRYSYVKPNKVIQTVRKLYGLEKSKSIHWVICFFHYLQIAQVFLPVFILFVPLFFSGDTAILLTFLIPLVPPVLIFIMCYPFILLQYIRCKILQKKNPQYANYVFYYSSRRGF